MATSAWGLLVLNKPSGISSHRATQTVRRLLGAKKAGHAGTLDPMATGVLLVALGRATRLLEYLEGHDKEYRAKIRLGEVRDTLDREGRVLETFPVPALDWEDVGRTLGRFRGRIEQVPPRYSAIKLKGEPLYRRVRRGELVDPPRRVVEIRRLELLDLSPPDLILELTCSKGTYVRSLARDLGQALGTGGTLWELLRTGSGPFHIREAVTLEEVKQRGKDAWSRVLPPDRMIGALPRVTIDDDDAGRLVAGREIPWSEETLGDRVAVFGAAGQLIAVARPRSNWLRPEKVFWESP